MATGVGPGISAGGHNTQFVAGKGWYGDRPRGLDHSLKDEQLEEKGRVENTTIAGFNREEVVRLCKDDLNFFAGLVMPTVFTLFFPPLHLAVWKILLDMLAGTEKDQPEIEEKFPKLAIGWPRGHAKTTLVKLFILYCILFSGKKFILIVGSNSQKAENILADICDMLSEDNISILFGDWKIAIELDRTDLKKFSFQGRSIILAALGSGGDPRGLNLKNERPDIILMDDMQARENAESPTQSKALLGWMVATLLKSKSPHGCISLYIGNMFSFPGSILKLLKKNSTWKSIIVAGILVDGTALWPELRSKEELMEELREDMAMGTPEAFFAEIMNDDEAGITSVFDTTKLPANPYEEADCPHSSFIIIDVATDKLSADDTTIIYYEIYEEWPVAVEMERGSFSPLATIKTALTMALKKGCFLIAVESVSYQSSLVFWFQHVCNEVKIEGIQFVELYPGMRTKNSRILTLFKSALKGEIFWRAALNTDIIWEATQFKPHKTNNVDNILDNLAYAADIKSQYAALAVLPLSVEGIETDSASVVSFNSAF